MSIAREENYKGEGNLGVRLSKTSFTLENIIIVLYLGIILILYFFKFNMSPDFIFLLLFLIIATIAFINQKRNLVGVFLKDWLPLILLYLGYEALRGVIHNVVGRAHITDLIAWELSLFGTIPTIVLQKLLYKGTRQWYDIILLIFYTSHFLLPFLAAFILWLKNRKFFKIFVSGFIILSFLGFITYLLFPAMPPWLASQQGYLPPIPRIIAETSYKIANGGFVTFVFFSLGGNPVAAMPSLHAAYPWLVALFLLYFYGKKTVWFLVVPLGVWFAIVYFGEHYIVDVFAGILYATIVFLLVICLNHKRH